MADYSESFDPAHEQEQELLVVQSIFMDEFKRLPDEPASGGHGICKVVQLTILPCPNEPDANHCDARLLVRLEPSYPIQPPLLTVQAGDLSQPSEAVLAGLRSLLKAKVAELAGHAQLMALAEAASEFIRAHNEPPKPQGPSFHEQMVQRQRQQRQASGEDELGEEGLTEIMQTLKKAEADAGTQNAKAADLSTLIAVAQDHLQYLQANGLSKISQLQRAMSRRALACVGKNTYRSEFQ